RRHRPRRAAPPELLSRPRISPEDRIPFGARLAQRRGAARGRPPFERAGGAPPARAAVARVLAGTGPRPDTPSAPPAPRQAARPPPAPAHRRDRPRRLRGGARRAPSGEPPLRPGRPRRGLQGIRRRLPRTAPLRPAPARPVLPGHPRHG